MSVMKFAFQRAQEKNGEAVKKILEKPFVTAEEIERTLGVNTAEIDKVRHEHKAYRSKLEQAGIVIFKIQKRKATLKEELRQLKGSSPAKSNLIREIKDLTGKEYKLYEVLPGLSDHMEYERLVRMTEAGEHFGHLGGILEKAESKKMAEKHGELRFHEASEKFPGTVVIMYGGCAYIIRGKKLGQALIRLMRRADAQRKHEQIADTLVAAALPSMGSLP